MFVVPLVYGFNVNNTYSVWVLCVTGRVTGYSQYTLWSDWYPLSVYVFLSLQIFFPVKPWYFLIFCNVVSIIGILFFIALIIIVACPHTHGECSLNLFLYTGRLSLNKFISIQIIMILKVLIEKSRLLLMFLWRFTSYQEALSNSYVSLMIFLRTFNIIIWILMNFIST